ncbi:MAG: choice-of-anchor D domain-containing protein [Gammaproteobacteria bacterium]|nr:choice-of-anchor D domain-containing protein [Gammaproteobacteria bacterium]
MSEQKFFQLALTAALIFSATAVLAVDFAIDPNSPDNGLFDIYSATFDPPLNPGGDPFFGGTPPATREITITPAPTGALAAADTTQCIQAFDPANPGPPIVPPCATLYPTATASSLDLTLSAGNTQLAINGGNVFFPNLTINISGSTNVLAEGASIVNLTASPGTVPINGSGVAVFEIDIAPSTAADFATFTEIVTGCTGPLCALIPILTLDMIRYRLTIDWNPSFTSFTADFIGQTANNSLVFATLDSGIPDITVTDSVDFGDVIKDTTEEQTITVTNDGLTDLVIAQIAQANPLAPPFDILTDNCSAQRVAPGADCTFDVQFAPTTTGNFPDSFDIPSNDPDESPVTITVSGTSGLGPLPEITVTDSVPPEDDLNMPFGNVIETMSADETITVTNIGTANLVLDQITVADPPGPFSVQNDACSMQVLSPLPPDNTCTLTIRFAPSATGMFSGSVDIPSNDPNVALVMVIVDGTGAPSPSPDISVTDPVPPADDLMIPFGNVTEATAADRAVTITNEGNGNLVMGQIAQADPLENTFSILSDNCSAQIIAPADSCAVEVRFLPTRVDGFTDSFDIPSNDPDEASLTFSVTGSGVAVGTGTINLTPDGADSGFFGSALRPATVLALLGLMAANLRRRKHSEGLIASSDGTTRR